MEEYLEYFSKDEFDKLWNLNSIYPNEDKNYENTRNQLTVILKYPRLTNDNKPVDFELIYARYKAHVRVRNLINDGTEPKYIKKENRVFCLFDYLFDNMFLMQEAAPAGTRHYYFWDTMIEEEIVDKFNAFQNFVKSSKNAV